MKKRFLASLLSLVMLLTLLPVTAFAAGETTPAVTSVSVTSPASGVNATLNEDKTSIALSGYLPAPTQSSTDGEVTLEIKYNNAQGTETTKSDAKVALTYTAAAEQTPAFWAIAENASPITLIESSLTVTVTCDELKVGTPPAITNVESKTTDVTASFADGTVTLGGSLAAPTSGTTGTVALTFTYTDADSKELTADVNVTLTYDTTDTENPAWKLPDSAEVTVVGDLKATLAGTVAVKATAPTTYTITVDSNITNGKVSVDPAGPAAEGTEVSITATADTGYKVGTTTVTAADNSTVTVADGKFKMPAANVTVTVTFVKQDAATYTITVADATNGKVSVAPVGPAAEGTEVSITATADTGYEVDTITVKTADNSTVTVTDGKFKMPAANVTVTVTFKATTSAPSKDTTVTEEVDVPDTGKVEATVKPTETVLNNKIAEAEKATGEDKAVTFEVTATGDNADKAKTADITLSKADVKAVSDKDIAVVVKTPVATVNVPAATMKKIVSATTTADVKLVVDEAPETDVGKNFEAAGSFDVKFKDAANKEVKVDSELTLTMKVKTNLKKVWVYIYKDGKPSVIGDTDKQYDVNGDEVTFTVPHLTTFAAKEAQDTTAKPETKVELSFETAENVAGGIVTVTGVEADKLHVIQITKKIDNKNQASVISFVTSDENGVLKFQAQGDTLISVFAPKTAVTDSLTVKTGDLKALKYEWPAVVSTENS